MSSFESHLGNKDIIPKAKIENIEDRRFEAERHSLETGFGAFNSIREKEGLFEVVLPGLVDVENNYTVGGSIYKFDNWDDAKKYYLKYMESREVIKTEPIFEIDLNDQENLAFSDFDKFNPIVAPRNESRKIPDSVKKYFLEEETNNQNFTYENTIKRESWDKELFSFVKNYLNTNEGAVVAERVGFKNLNLLTPREAIKLTSEIVVGLTKYNYEEMQDKAGDTTSDNLSTLDLLESGIENKNDLNWKGNGVCRNFASATKAIFESLKINQTEYNFLRDTHCLYTDGIEHRNEKNNSNTTRMNDTGHAWNTFLTVSDMESNTVVLDTTWAKRDLETKEIENLDYTIDRTNHIVAKVVSDLDQSNPETADKINNFIKYQEKVFSGKRGSELEAVSTDFVKTLNNFVEVPTISHEIILSLTQSYGYSSMIETADPSEIDSLYKISKNNKNLPFDFILDGYLKNKPLSNYHVKKLLFKEDALQRKVLQKIKNHPQFENLVNSSFEFKNRIQNL